MEILKKERIIIQYTDNDDIITMNPMLRPNENLIDEKTLVMYGYDKQRAKEIENFVLNGGNLDISWMDRWQKRNIVLAIRHNNPKCLSYE
jgi:hypothetical protein